MISRGFLAHTHMEKNFRLSTHLSIPVRLSSIGSTNNLSESELRYPTKRLQIDVWAELQLACIAHLNGQQSSVGLAQQAKAAATATATAMTTTNRH